MSNATGNEVFGSVLISLALLVPPNTSKKQTKNKQTNKQTNKGLLLGDRPGSWMRAGNPSALRLLVKV
jgi:hypothetical protein